MIANLASKKYKLQQWTELIHDCKSSGLKVEEWCIQNGISKHKYYYRLRKVREAMLLTQSVPEIVPVPEAFITHELTTELASATSGELKVQVGDIIIHVNGSTPAALLKMTLEAVNHAK